MHISEIRQLNLTIMSSEHGVAILDELRRLGHEFVAGVELATAASGGSFTVTQGPTQLAQALAQVDLDTYEDKAARARLYMDRHSPSKAPLD